MDGPSYTAEPSDALPCAHALLDELLAAHPGEFEAFVKQAQTRLALNLGRYAARDVLESIEWPEFRALWRTYRQRTLAEG